MKYTKLNKNWDAEPAAPELTISAKDEGIELTFFLHAAQYPHIDDGDKGTLKFSGVYAYRLGPPNKEEYACGKFRFANAQLPWGGFYELNGTDWNQTFPGDKIILNEGINKNNLRHFIFFLKDETFECLATDYHFIFVDTISERLDEKYPKGYLHHYLAMFTANFDTPSVDNYGTYTNLYIQMESIKEFNDLKNEIRSIRTNNDLPLYVKVVNYFGMANFGLQQLNDMIRVIETYKTGK